MSPIAIASVIFACVFGGAILGMFLRTKLPENHLSSDTKDVVKVATALIATMAALVLGLLISSAKSSYDTRNSEVVQMSGQILLFDRTLAHYGPEAADARALLRSTVAAGIERVWPSGGGRSPGINPTASPAELLYDKVDELSPTTEAQRAAKAQALQVAKDLGHYRFLLLQQLGSSIPFPFLVILVFWLMILFVSFGLFAPGNATVAVVFLICSLSVSGAIFLILELDSPLAGVIQVSPEPLRQALARLGQ